MSDLAKLTAEELLERGRLNAPCQPGSVMAEIRRRLERLEQCEKDAAEWKAGADILGERLIATEKRLEKCEQAIALYQRAHNEMTAGIRPSCRCIACDAARAALEDSNAAR